MGIKTEKTGSLSIDKDNLFSILKKWLYSEQDIFFRELISNGCDAITKRKYLISQGEVSEPTDEPWRIDVILTPSSGTIKFIDNGIGMTEEEVDLYINQIAVSGVTSFAEKYSNLSADEHIIGHFGLGFYSAFIEAEIVCFDTLSCKNGAGSVHWESDGSTGYVMTEGSRTTPGTEITLYMSGDGMRFLNKGLAKQIIKKYCGYMPVSIYLTDTEEEESETLKEKEPVNQTEPLWKTSNSDRTEAEYISFYHELFPDPLEPDPLFWIDLSAQEPFQLEGILYFPKLRDDTDSLDGVIKLYSNRVFVAENVKEVIPDYLMLLKGVIDCPSFPVNVSRSSLQADSTVKAISAMIGQLVTEKLENLYKDDPNTHADIWPDINPVVKYGCLKNKAFRKALMDMVVYRKTDGGYITIKQYQEHAKNRNLSENVVYYTDFIEQQQQYIELLEQEDIYVLCMEHVIDQPYIQLIETWHRGLVFKRVDSDISEILNEEISDETEEQLKDFDQEMTEIFRKVSGKEHLNVCLQKYKIKSIAAMLSFDEGGRRLKDMIREFNIKHVPGVEQMSEECMQEILTLNISNNIVQYLMKDHESDLSKMICAQLYDMALLNYDPGAFDRIGTFTTRSNQIIELLLENIK